MDWVAIGARIRKQREQFGYTREAFAEKLDITPKFCADIELGNKGMSVQTLCTGKFMLTIFGAVAELEREYILQRQAEGIAIAKSNGVYKGRRPVIRPDFEPVVKLWRSRKITATDAMKRLDMKPSTFYRRVKEMRL